MRRSSSSCGACADTRLLHWQRRRGPATRDTARAGTKIKGEGLRGGVSSGNADRRPRRCVGGGLY